MKTKVKNIAAIQTGLFAKPSGKGEVVYLQSKYFDEHGQLRTQLFPDLPVNQIPEKHLLNPGDILFAAKGTKNFATVYAENDLPAVASTSFFIIRLTDNNILPAYLAWFLNHPKTMNLLKGNARGTSIPSITKTVLENLEMTVPAPEKQKLIIRISQLARKESELREKIRVQRKKLIEQQIINAIK